MNFICSIKIFAAYIAIVMLGLCTGAFLYMTYSLCTVLVAGQKFSAFSSGFFLQGIFEVLPTVLSLCPLFISFYLIRHKEIPWYSVLVCMILHLCLWIFFIPALKEKLEISVYKNKEMQAAVSLSPGYFRVSQDNRYVLYYSEVDSENNASGVCIDKSKSNGNVFTFSSEKPAIFQDEFSDPLIKNTVEMPVLLKQILKYFQKFTVSSYSRCSENFVSWIIFSSIIFAFTSVVWIKNISAWRLVNVLFILMDYIFVFFLNFFILGADDSLFQKIPILIKSVPTKSLLVCVLNIFIFAAAFILWLISRLVKENSPEPAYYGDDL